MQRFSVTRDKIKAWRCDEARNLQDSRAYQPLLIIPAIVAADNAVYQAKHFAVGAGLASVRPTTGDGLRADVENLHGLTLQSFAGSALFERTFDEGMALVEETARYLDGEGRSDNRVPLRQPVRDEIASRQWKII